MGKFTLHGFWIKPLDAPEGGVRVRLRGYEAKTEDGEGGGKGEKVREWWVDFPSGWHEMFQVEMKEVSGEVWEGLERVEIVADFGEDRLDWEFCVDDLEVEFFSGKGKDEVEDGGAALEL